MDSPVNGYSAERIGAVPGAPGITFLVDREGDSAAMLGTLVATKHDFIVRGNWDRLTHPLI